MMEIWVNNLLKDDGMKGDAINFDLVAAALRRSNETVLSRPLKSALKALSPLDSTWKGTF